MPPKAASKVKEIDEEKLVPGSIILYRLRGYPPWPSLVVTEEHIPPAVKKVRPGGNVYPIRFFPIEKKPEYAWANPKSGDIQSILTKEEIDAFNENPPKKGVNKACLVAWKAAADPVDLDKLKITIEEHEEMEDVAEEEGEEEEEEEDAALEDVKDLYEDEDEEGTTKKRKRAATDNGDNEKPKKKKPAVVTQKKRAPKKAEQNGAKPERKKPGPKPKKQQAAESPKKKSAEDKAKALYEYRKKEIMYIRHRIQKALLDKSGKEPEVEELPGILDNLKKLADLTYINASLIAETKMQKVLKRIGALPPLPEEDKFDIKKRAAEILKSWQPHLDEINEISRKEEGKEKTDENEKMALEESETGKKEAEGGAESMEEVESAEKPTETSAGEKSEGKQAEKPVEEGKAAEGESVEAQSAGQPSEEKSEAMDTTADVGEDFVMVESGGEADAHAQELATEAVEGGLVVQDSSAGAANPKESEAEHKEEPTTAPDTMDNE